MEKKKKRPLVMLQARVREDQHTKLAARAKHEKKTQAELVREFLDKYLNN